MTQQTQNKIENFLENLDTDIDILNYVNIENIDFLDAFNSIYDMIQDNGGFDIEVTYYSNAMNYLKVHDPSLCISLELADEYGHKLENINSEILASLLKSHHVREEFNDLQHEIDTFFNPFAVN